MSTPIPEVIGRYFEADARRDVDAIVALFAEDAAVVDEGQTRRGTAEIRAWQEGAASQYQYTTEIFDTRAAGDDRFLVTGRLKGNFPGGIANLNWHFTVAGDRIHALEIAP